MRGALTSGPRRAAGRAGTVLRGSALRGRRLAFCGALAVASVVVGGSVGVLLAIADLIVIIDSVIPLPGASWSAADDRFARLVRQRRHAGRPRRLGTERLDVLDDRRGWAASAERRPLGIQPIAIDSVTGTVEESKAAIFDRCFRPVRSERERWTRLWVAHAHGAALPPISVYRVDGRHIVRDGHHRVSVARDHGFSTIDADVVELRRAPGVPDLLRRGVAGAQRDDVPGVDPDRLAAGGLGEPRQLQDRATRRPEDLELDGFA